MSPLANGLGAVRMVFPLVQSTGRQLLETAVALMWMLAGRWADAVGALGVRKWSAEVMTKATVVGCRWPWSCSCEGPVRWHTGETGFRVEVVISWYGGQACSRSDGRCDVKGRMGSKACGAVRKWNSGLAL